MYTKSGLEILSTSDTYYFFKKRLINTDDIFFRTSSLLFSPNAYSLLGRPFYVLLMFLVLPIKLCIFEMGW